MAAGIPPRGWINRLAIVKRRGRRKGCWAITVRDVRRRKNRLSEKGTEKVRNPKGRMRRSNGLRGLSFSVTFLRAERIKRGKVRAARKISKELSIAMWFTWNSRVKKVTSE